MAIKCSSRFSVVGPQSRWKEPHPWPSLRTENRELRTVLLQLLNRHVLIRIDAHLAGNLHGFLGDLAGRKFRVLGQRLRRGLRVRSARADCRDPAIGL